MLMHKMHPSRLSNLIQISLPSPIFKVSAMPRWACRSKLFPWNVMKLLDCVFYEIYKRDAEAEECRLDLRCLLTQDAEATAI